jgi:hypothetical protein
MTANPHGSHVVKTRTKGDKNKPEIYCMALSPDGSTVTMADSANQNIKLISDFPSGSLSAIALDSPPRGLVWVSEGQLAVTPLHNYENCLWIVNLKKGVLQADTVNKIQTDRSYRGIAEVRENDTTHLIVSCDSESDGIPTSVDLLSTSGKTVRTLVSHKTLADMLSRLPVLSQRHCFCV